MFSDKYKDILVKSNIPYDLDDSCKKPLNKNHSGYAFSRFSKGDIEEGIKQLKPSIGMDGIHSNHLKNSTELYVELVSELFASFALHCFVPSNLIRGTIAPTIKDRYGMLNSSDNYRPVMSSSVFLKLFEYCLLKKIRPYVNLNDRQHGFRANYSTSTAFLALKETTLNYLRSKSDVYACFIDISKAFDSVDHEILMQKLLDCGIPVMYVDLIRYWYSNQNINVRFKSKYSTEWKVTNGVRQGGVLSGFFFSIYLNSLIDKVSCMKYGCRLDLFKANIIVYADDIVLLAPSVSALQFLLNEAVLEAKKLKLKFNSQKSKFMVFSLVTNKIPVKKIVSIDNEPLQQVNSYRYLGYILSDNLSVVDDMSRALSKFYADFNMILRKFNFTDIKVKLFLFKQYCLQLYGSEMWYNSSRSLSTLRQFAIGYHKAIKKILGLSYHESNHYACQESNLLTFEHFLNKNRITAVLRMLTKPCAFIEKSIYFFIISSVFYNETAAICKKKYDIEDLFENDREAIFSRILFVQNHETPMREGWE